MMIKEDKQTADACTQYTQRDAPVAATKAKVKTKEIGVIAVSEQSKIQVKTASIAIETDVKMGSREYNSEVTSLQSTGKKKGNKNRKNSKPTNTDFDDEFIVSNYDLSKNLNRGKRGKSHDKSKSKHKATSHETLKPRTKYGTSTPE